MAHRAGLAPAPVPGGDLGRARELGEHGLDLGALDLARGGARQVDVPEVHDRGLAGLGQGLHGLAQGLHRALVALGAAHRGDLAVVGARRGIALGHGEARDALAALAVVDADDRQLLHAVDLAEGVSTSSG